jgi:hypothetical protein
MQTFTGKKFYPLNPRVEDVCIEDIAHALSLYNRFGGHTKFPYSVAAHSIHVSDLCKADPMGGLMHDATEAYMGDMIRPLKFCFPEFKRYEDDLQSVIAEALGIPFVHHPSVKHCDNVALMTERRDAWKCNPVDSWGEELESLEVPRGFLPYAFYEPSVVEGLFIARFNMLLTKKPA